MNIAIFFMLIHPVLAVIFVYPLMGIVVKLAWQTRQRRLQNLLENQSKIPPIVGHEHQIFGNWLTSGVVGLNLVGLAHAIGKNIIRNQLWQHSVFFVVFILSMFVFTVASLVFLYRAKQRIWRGVFASLTGAGLIILGCQQGVFRRTNEWYWSHYYIGMFASLLMIFAVAIVQDIYQDRSLRWRWVHIILSCMALFLFIGQGITGTRDLLAISLN
jgi:hypothetical protein